MYGCVVVDGGVRLGIVVRVLWCVRDRDTKMCGEVGWLLWCLLLGRGNVVVPIASTSFREGRKQTAFGTITLGSLLHQLRQQLLKCLTDPVDPLVVVVVVVVVVVPVVKANRLRAFSIAPWYRR